MLLPILAAGVFDQDPPHGLRCGCEEVALVLPMLLLTFAVEQPNVGLVNQSRRIERLSRLFVGELLCRQPSQLGIDKISSRSAACGSPCSISDKICVTSDMKNALGQKGQTA